MKDMKINATAIRGLHWISEGEAWLLSLCRGVECSGFWANSPTYLSYSPVMSEEHRGKETKTCFAL